MTPAPKCNIRYLFDSINTQPTSSQVNLVEVVPVHTLHTHRASALLSPALFPALCPALFPAVSPLYVYLLTGRAGSHPKLHREPKMTAPFLLPMSPCPFFFCTPHGAATNATRMADVEERMTQLEQALDACFLLVCSIFVFRK